MKFIIQYPSVHYPHIVRICVASAATALGC